MNCIRKKNFKESSEWSIAYQLKSNPFFNSKYYLDIHPVFGVCVKSKYQYTPGDLICRIAPKIIKNKPCLHSVQVAKNIHIYDEWFAGRINHSCEPNIIFDQKSLTFYAIKTIEPDQILTQDYELTEDELFSPFFCKCGSEYCRGYIAGRNGKWRKKLI
jgi:hypothetical protein